MIEFRLPSLGAEMDEGTLLEWKVQPGDAVKKGDVVAVVDTSKSAIDVEIWETGTVWELVHQPPEVLPVGTVIARLLEPGETPDHAEAEKRRKAAASGGRVKRRPGVGGPLQWSAFDWIQFDFQVLGEVFQAQDGVLNGRRRRLNGL